VRFLADENLPRDLVLWLREQGHDVSWIGAEAPGSEDPEIASAADREQRVLITFDKDFGELFFRQRLFAESGVILLRVKGRPEPRLAVALAALQTQEEWTGRFVVIEDGRVRVVRRSDT
jgi:predicted nuclease of predicted toxin-antitoxin system